MSVLLPSRPSPDLDDRRRVPPAGTRVPPAPRSPWWAVDATTVLTVWLVVTMVVPSQSVVAALGSVGAPSTLLALATACWWLWDQLHRRERLVVGAQPVRLLALTLVVVIVLVYRHAMAQPVVPDELLPADSGLIRLVAIVGIVVTASDGITTTERLTDLLRRLTWVMGGVGLLALAQIVSGQPLIDQVVIPGLSSSGNAGELIARGAFLRASGTSVHPIEFGAVLVVALPLMVAFARTTTRHRAVAWGCVGVIGVNLLLSVSRTAILGALLGMLVVVSAWSRRDALRAVGVGLVGLVGAAVTVPGLLGTLRGLFLGAAGDSSVQSRTGSYDYVVQAFLRDPWLGRGYGTFLPRYYILDNGYLLLLLEAGAIGLAVFLGLFGAAMLCATMASRRAPRRPEQELARGVLGALAAGALSVGFFDIFSFPQSAAMIALSLGLAGAVWRLARSEWTTQHAPAPSAALVPAPASGALACRGAAPAPVAVPLAVPFGVAVQSEPSVKDARPGRSRAAFPWRDLGPGPAVVLVALGTVAVLLAGARADAGGLAAAGWWLLSVVGLVAVLRPELRERSRVVLVSSVALGLAVAGAWELRGGAVGQVSTSVASVTRLPLSLAVLLLLVLQQAVVVGSVLVVAPRFTRSARVRAVLALAAAAACALLLPPGRWSGVVVVVGLTLGGLALLSSRVVPEPAARPTVLAPDRRWWTSVLVGSAVAALVVVPVVLRVHPVRAVATPYGAVVTPSAAPVSLRVGTVDGARVEVEVTGADDGAVLEVRPPAGTVTSRPLPAADAAGERTVPLTLPGSGRYVVAVRTASGGTLSTLVLQR